MEFSDLILEQKIQSLQANVKQWAISREMWDDCGFKTPREAFDDEPNEGTACVTVLWCEGPMWNMLNGYNYSDELDEFQTFIDTQEFYWDHVGGVSYGFFTKDDDLNERYLEYFEWQWICGLIRPNYTSLYQEIFDYFHRKPDLLYQLSPRQFEILISEVFANQGYRSELGTGQSDGGVDIRLYKKDEIDEIVTLVQVKKYKPGLPVKLDAVAALSAIVNGEHASRGLFVTTSRYLPGVMDFAARKVHRLTLADSMDVSHWCESARNIIQRDKSQSFTDENLMQLLSQPNNKNLAGKIVMTTNGYNMVRNQFCLVVKDTESAALLMYLPAEKNFNDPPYNTRGNEVPALDQRILDNRTKEKVFRTKKITDQQGRVTFWGGGEIFSIWDGQAQYFDYND
ncbi:restriction endonuclease [Pedobacter gandavensis]|uniref:restriction endonuclease n=1 Tax=Pedobacter gandavensis TaxID=2679963 RepID=UPI00247A085E|nr:restriction endonuclease [Pedobacter gandavensis]WGQ08952.1 restriction endonuclease [Pedobacter gandavensis]